MGFSHVLEPLSDQMGTFKRGVGGEGSVEIGIELVLKSFFADLFTVARIAGIIFSQAFFYPG